MSILIAKFFSRIILLSLILLAAISIYFTIDLEYRYYLTLLVLSFVIPLLSIILFKRLKITSDYNVSIREERPKIFLVMGICFLASLYISILLGNTNLIVIYTVLNISFIIGFVITLFWKISFHMIWSIIAIFFIVYLWNDPLLLILLLFVPFIAWSRIALKRHSLSQIVAGFALSSLTIFFVLTFCKF
jgi:membrane-associated phospholipid phosphatase